MRRRVAVFALCRQYRRAAFICLRQASGDKTATSNPGKGTSVLDGVRRFRRCNGGHPTLQAQERQMVVDRMGCNSICDSLRIVGASCVERQ